MIIIIMDVDKPKIVRIVLVGRLKRFLKTILCMVLRFVIHDSQKEIVYVPGGAGRIACAGSNLMILRKEMMVPNPPIKIPKLKLNKPRSGGKLGINCGNL